MKKITLLDKIVLPLLSFLVVLDCHDVIFEPWDCFWAYMYTFYFIGRLLDAFIKHTRKRKATN